YRVLRRNGCARAQRQPRPAANRYEYGACGELVHLDIKKLGRFWQVGKRILQDGVHRNEGAGWQYAHVAVDVECPRFRGQLTVGLSGPAERLSGHAKETEVSKAVSAGVSA
ncbi:MAG TPA: hypothetical protein VFP39_07725, partial [Gemmatimonadales bacterium]|nr:hypothetical protein [Gemmatimonadales bacterium]